MNRRGFLSLFSAAPAVLIPIAQSAPEPPAPIPEPEVMVACAGPYCCGLGNPVPGVSFAVPRSRCACELTRAYYAENNWRT
jgi:hypothetical protein